MRSSSAKLPLGKAKSNVASSAGTPATFPQEPAGRRRTVAAMLFLGTMLLFARTMGNEFVNYDDPDYVTANEHVRQGLTIDGLKWAVFSLEKSNWHPLTWVSHMVDWQLYGDRPAGHHGTNVLWHALTAVMTFAALRRLTGAFWTSAVCAALFAWHPLRVESVAWVAERKDLLSGFFWMATLWAYAGYAEKRREGLRGMREYALALGMFACGLMSKPMLVTLPCVLLLLDFWPLRRATTGDGAKTGIGSWGKLIAEKTPFFVLSAAASWITIVAQSDSGALSTVLTFDERLANAACAILRYGAKFFLPVDLAVLYPHPGHWPAGQVSFALVCILAVSAVAAAQWRRRPWLLFGWFWFLGTLVPVSGLVQVGVQSMADRYTYIPMLGVQIALLLTMREAVGPASWRTAAWVISLVLTVCAARTFGQIAVWKNSLTLFDQAVAVTKQNYVAHDNRGLYLYKAGRIDEAMNDYRAALAINPGYLNANNNLGHAFYELGQPANAIPLLRLALKAQSTNLEVRNNLANALSDVGQLAEATEHYDYVLARQPNHSNALNGSAVLLAMQNRPAEAKLRLEQALRFDPQNASAEANLGNVCSMLGLQEEALGHYRRAIELNPKDAHTHYIVGTLLNQLGKPAEAVELLQRSLTLRPNHPDALAQLGLALMQIGRREEGLQAWRSALKVQPGHLQAASWLKAATEGK